MRPLLRLAAALGAGAAAGALWAASGALNWYLIFVRSTVHAQLVNAVVPATFGRETALDAPGVAVCVAAALLVAAGVGLSAWLAAHSATVTTESSPRHRWALLFVSTWLGAVLASTVAALAVATGQAAQAIPHAFIANGADWPWVYVVTSAYWGALAGWLPALVAVVVAVIVARSGQAVHSNHAVQPAAGDAATPAHPQLQAIPRAIPATAIGVGGILVLALVTGGLSFAAESSAWVRNHSVEPGIARPSSPPPSITAAPEPTETVVPLPPPEEDSERCAPDNTLLTIGPEDAALGHRALTIYLTNAGTTACDAFGYPSLTFSSAEGSPLTIAVEPDASTAGQNAGPTKVVLAPGATAKTVLSWRSAGRFDADGAVASLRIAPVSGGYAVPFMLRLDLVDGGNATITAWKSAARTAQ